MEHYLSHTDYPIWQVIQNGNGLVSVIIDTNGMIKVLPPKTAKEVVARKTKRKARTTLLMALPEDHLAKFYKMADEKEMWVAIKSRFGGNDESKKMQKYLLQQQFKGFSVSASEGLHKGFNDLYNDLRVFERDVKGTTASLSSSNTHNITDDDIEEMDLKWQVAMISERIKKFYKITRRKLQFDTKDLVGFDKTKVECFNFHKIGHFVRDCRAKGNQDSRRRDGGYNGNKARDNGRRPAYQDDSKALVTIDGEDIDWLKKLYDEQRDKLGDASLEIIAYTLALKRLLNTQMIANDKSGLGYGDYIYGSILSYENEVLQSVFMNKECDLEDTPVNDRYAEGMHATLAKESDSKPVEYASRNKAYLADYQEFKGAPVAFGGSNGRITGKGKIKASSFNLKNIDPSGDLSCLFTKASIDKSSKWHRRLGHVNFKNLNKLRKGNVVRGLPSKIFENDHTCIACQKGKQHKAFCNSKIAEAVNTACDVLNRVLVTKPQNKTPYELLTSRQPIISYPRPFGFHVTILNTIDHLGKFDGKSDSGFLVEYYLNSKAFRVYNLETKRVKENLHYKIKLTNLQVQQKLTLVQEELEKLKRQEKEANNAVRKETIHENQNANTNNTNLLNVVTTPISIGGPSIALNDGELSYPDDPLMPHLEDIYASLSEGIFTDSSYDDEGMVTDFNLATTVTVSPTPTTRIHTIHPKTQILGVPMSAVQTRSKVHKNSEAYALFQIQKVWILVDLPFRKKASGTKWVYKKKKDERGVVVRNKACLVAQGHMQEEGIDYDEVFAPVAMIEAIRIFLAFASYMGFIVYQMDMKSAFLYGTINEEVYVTQPLVFVDPKFLNKVYKVLKALYGLHQAPRACVKTASTPIETQKPLVKDKEAADVDVHLYRSMIGSLMYLTASRPDIMFAVCACSRFQVTSKTSHLQAVKRIFRRLISWQCKKQTIVATSTTKAEYVAAAHCCGQVLWIQNQLLDYGFNIMNTKIYIDNESTICIVKNPVFHSKTKHIEIRHHFIRDAYEKKLIQVLKIHIDDNVVDLLTKAFDVSMFKFLYQFDENDGIGVTAVDLKFLLLCILLLLAKRITWNEFSCSMASAVICLATGRKFNFSKYIFDSIVRNVDSPSKFLMVGKGFSRVETPLFATMLVQPQVAAEEEDKTCTTLPHKVNALEQDKVAQALEILMLKSRVKKLEKRRRSKSSGLKRLRKEGRIKAIDVDKDVTLVDAEVNLGVEDQRRTNDVSAVKDTSVDEPTVFDDEEVTMTMAQTLIKMKAEKARILDEQTVKRLHEEEIEQVAAREKQEQDDFKRAQVLQQQKYQSLKRKPTSVAQARKNMIVYLKNMAGYKMAHFKEMKNLQRKELLKRHCSRRVLRKLRAEVKVLGSESTQDTPIDDLKEMFKEDAKNMLQIVPVSEFKMEALQVKVGGITQAYQSFEDMLKDFDREDLDALWILVKERFSTAVPTVDKEKALWVELKRLFEPDAYDVIWKLQ
nr:putative ribonuclease H-like domain-containing protein [Tanacetum cinerariifolium]